MSFEQKLLALQDDAAAAREHSDELLEGFPQLIRDSNMHELSHCEEPKNLKFRSLPECFENDVNCLGGEYLCGLQEELDYNLGEYDHHQFASFNGDIIEKAMDFPSYLVVDSFIEEKDSYTKMKENIRCPAYLNDAHMNLEAIKCEKDTSTPK